ncbi:MAG: veratrol--corrinoid protein metyltransferase [Lachnospiraceae bacterium]|nr:veratrol--corrinoid protein metyltransferase [Lachnospiraceae bacterium]
MAVLTEKENMMRLLRGEIPEWIPRYTIGPVRGLENKTPAVGSVAPRFLNEHRFRGGGKDIWGVEYITSHEAAGGLMPKSWDFILDDVTKWRDVIKAPSLEGFDWEALCKKDLETSRCDRTQSALAMSVGHGYFQELMAYMGFTEGLCALYEEPEECEALFNYLADFYCEIVEKTIDYYKPDIYNLADDTAAWGNPFVSLDMFRRFFLPMYKREMQAALDRGIPVLYHNCGKCEIFIPDMVEAGITSWNPAQTCNDLVGIQEKYGRDLVLMGCWDTMNVVDPKLSDQDIYDYFQSIADARAKNGGFAFLVTILLPDGDKDPRMLHVNDVVNKALAEIGHNFYK